jgi:hypothetical protein
MIRTYPLSTSGGSGSRAIRVLVSTFPASGSIRQSSAENLNELVKALESYEDSEYRAHLWLGDDQLGSMTRLDAYMTEVFRLLHNFVASVMKLVEHTRTTMRKLSLPCASSSKVWLTRRVPAPCQVPFVHGHMAVLLRVHRSG